MKRISNLSYVVAAALFTIPLVTFAQAGGKTVQGLLGLFSSIVGMLVPIVIGIAVLMFLWGILGYVTAKDQEGHTEALKTMASGAVVLFVMVSIWGLVNVLGSTLNLDTNAPRGPVIPTVTPR
jgi:hypothetical protein